MATVEDFSGSEACRWLRRWIEDHSRTHGCGSGCSAVLAAERAIVAIQSAKKETVR